MEFNSPKIKNRNGIKVSTVEKITLKRINDIYYIQINDGNIETLGKYTGSTFDLPVILGASPDTNPQRYFKGTLKNMEVHIID